MWLLSTSTLQLVYFVNEAEVYGRYAILSHVWLRPSTDEVTLQDIQTGRAEEKPGYAKIRQICQKALVDKLDYALIDTCCIDKTSSAELSEAINSIYRWYYEGKVCYAYLADVGPEQLLKDSKWFTRGWTLQELIAPDNVEFYDSTWTAIGSKHSLAKELAEITRIDIRVVEDRTDLQGISIAARMAWAADRKTSRLEDRAYSLMGIFDVNMPMLYGEGGKAFILLQEEIIRSSTDQSILAWDRSESQHEAILFAPSPYEFRLGHDILSWDIAGMDEGFILSIKGCGSHCPSLTTSVATTLLDARRLKDPLY